ncbi:copper chaperone PCu(A)C [Sphaerisporangium corydalis]|uniref:Copper chaperone PCu(A)C n=1 Tax=Sphaerisporangium corydalis TaxID=1441875 RepID=A0ABV9ERC6_9ACTN|nr:copper chaperone PCu(A)C [Sphaerisporangium corydalis]
MTSTSRRRVIAAAALLAAVPTLAACGAGSDANTSNAYAPTEANVLIDGTAGAGKTYGRNGIKIAQAFLLGPDAGAQIAQGGSVPLYLTMVNYGTSADTLQGVAVADQSFASVKAQGSITLPPGQLVNTGRPASTVVLEGSKKPLYGGENLAVTLKFANAGDIDMAIPVVTRSREFTTLSPAPSAPPAAATPSPTASQGTTDPAATPTASG